MNKGDSDYLDLDPIRRIADSGPAAPVSSRVGQEQVAEGYAIPSNPPAVLGNDTRADPPTVVLQDFGASNRQNFGPNPNNPNFVSLQRAALSQRKGLGVVLPVEIPPNYSDEGVAYWAPTSASGTPVLCSPGVFGLTNPDPGNPGLCPDGSALPCLLPVNVDDPAHLTYNCLTNSPLPSRSPIRDARVYNLLVVNSGGHYSYDNYMNPNLALPAVRQKRVVSAFYRLHTSQTTNFGGSVTGGPCKQFSSTDQIGCLVKANPCSLGFAGREAVDDNLNMAFQIGRGGSSSTILALPPGNARIQNLLTHNGPAYPLARTLWVSATNKFIVSPPSNEATLLGCFGNPSIVDGAVTNHNYVPVPAGIDRNRNCPATFSNQSSDPDATPPYSPPGYVADWFNAQPQATMTFPATVQIPADSPAALGFQNATYGLSADAKGIAFAGQDTNSGHSFSMVEFLVSPDSSTRETIFRYSDSLHGDYIGHRLMYNVPNGDGTSTLYNAESVNGVEHAWQAQLDAGGNVLGSTILASFTSPRRSASTTNSAAPRHRRSHTVRSTHKTKQKTVTAWFRDPCQLLSDFGRNLCPSALLPIPINIGSIISQHVWFGSSPFHWVANQVGAVADSFNHLSTANKVLLIVGTVGIVIAVATCCITPVCTACVLGGLASAYVLDHDVQNSNSNPDQIQRQLYLNSLIAAGKIPCTSLSRCNPLVGCDPIEPPSPLNQCDP